MKQFLHQVRIIYKACEPILSTPSKLKKVCCIKIQLKKEQPPTENLFFGFKHIDGNYKLGYANRSSIHPDSKFDTSTGEDRIVTRYSKVS